jgi:hypothetical protein
VVQPGQKYWTRLPCIRVAEQKGGVVVTAFSGYSLEIVLLQNDRLEFFGSGRKTFLKPLPAHVPIALKF